MNENAGLDKQQKFLNEIAVYFDRLFRRKNIERAQHTHENSSLREIIQNTRQREKRTGYKELYQSTVRETVRELLDSMVVENKASIELLEMILPELQSRFPWIQAIVLIGSGAHGGKRLRKLSRTYGQTDVDWGIIYDSTQINQAFELFEGVTKAADGILSQIKQEKRLPMGLSPDVQFCFFMNPKHVYGRSLPSVKDPSFLDKLDFWYFPGTGASNYGPHQNRSMPNLGAIQEAMLFFQPTLPRKIGENNVKRLLFYLSELSTSDHNRWELLASDLKSNWREIHHIKSKHFSKYDEKVQEWAMSGNRELYPSTGERKMGSWAGEISDKSADAMASQFDLLIDQTDQSGA